MLVQYFIIMQLFECVTLTEVNNKIKGKKVNKKSYFNRLDYKYYYQNLFQSIDVHPKLYGNNLESLKNNKIVREDIIDDNERDKHTLIFNQVYNVYKKMLRKRKLQHQDYLNVKRCKKHMNMKADEVEEIMKDTLNREMQLNHNKLKQERERISNELEKKTLSSKVDNGKAIELIVHKDKSYDKKILNNLEQHDLLKKFHDQIDEKIHKAEENKQDIRNEDDVKKEFKEKMKDKIQNVFGLKSTKKKKPTRTTTTEEPTVNWHDFTFDPNATEEEEEVTMKGDGYWDRIKNRRLNLTRRERMKTTWSSSEAADYWRAWTPDPRYTFGLEEFNGSAVEKQTWVSYEEENATFTTLPDNWLTWLYSGVSEDLANQTTYESCPTHEIVDRYYTKNDSFEIQLTPAKNQTWYWPNKDMFTYKFRSSDASEWDEREFHHFPPNPTYFDRNLVTEYLTWRPVKRADFSTTKRQPSTWTELYYTNDSANHLYVAPTVYWIDDRTPSKRTPGSWEQVDSVEHTRPTSTIPPYPNPPRNFTCPHCNGTPAVFSHENNYNNHELEHLINGTLKANLTGSEEHRDDSKLPNWEFMFSQESADRRAGIKQTRMTDVTYVSYDYSHEMAKLNKSFQEKIRDRVTRGLDCEGWDRDSVVYQYYEDLKPTTVYHNSEYYYNSEEWAEIKEQRQKQAEKEKLMKNLNNYMSQKHATFPSDFNETSLEFEKKKKLLDSLEIFRREYLKNLTRSTVSTTTTEQTSTTTKQTTPTSTTTKRTRRPFIIQDQIDQYFYSESRH